MTRVGPLGVRLVRELVRELAGIELGSDKAYLVDARLAALARAEGLAGPEAVVARLQQDGDPLLARRVVESLMTNETFFFRDERAFQALRAQVIPHLLARTQGSVRIWSAACSTGQEPYSVAMLVAELSAGASAPPVEIVATDLDSQALARAREGRYRPDETGRGLSAGQLERHFAPAADGFRLSRHIRDRVTFRELNLAGDWPDLGTFDLILMRNVLIYFPLETKASVLSRATRLLGHDGLLVLGAGESLLGVDVPLERVPLGSASAYRRRPGAGRLA